MRAIIGSIEASWRRYKTLSEQSFEQLEDSQLGLEPPGGGNSIAVNAVHIAGNLKSRFTDFRTDDGEKPWRDRDSEFLPRPNLSRDEMLQLWNEGWNALFATLAALADADLHRTVTIRGEQLPVYEALHQLMTHTSYHAGQIVYAAKAVRGSAWRCLSIPLGKSQDYYRKPGA